MTERLKQYEVLNWASLFLEVHQCEAKNAEIWLQHLLRMNRTDFLLNMRKSLTAEIITQFKDGIYKHVETGVPIQHLIGMEMFYGRSFIVNEHVLIPRQETEELVQHVIDIENKFPMKKPLTIADIGTGSGVIATTIALEIPRSTLYATDISPQALQVAKRNAQRLSAAVHFLEGDFLHPLVDHGIEVDMLVSNPPYIATSDRDMLSRTVKHFDPELALFADDNGLAAYKQILSLARKVMKRQGYIIFEIGYDQGEEVSALVKAHFPNSDIHLLQDMNGHDRIVSAAIDGRHVYQP